MNEQKKTPDERNQKPKKFISKHSKTILIVVLALVFAGGFLLWKKVIKDYVIPRNFGVVEDGLIYRSGRISARLIKNTLIEYNIRVIIDLTDDKLNDADQDAEKKAANDLNIERILIPLRGNGTGDVNSYAYAIETIVEAKKKNEPVLVHCAGGTQRTGGVIAAYRLLVEQKDPSFVLKELKQYGWYTRDKDLVIYLNENMAKLAGLLEQKHIIERVPAIIPQLGSGEK